MEGALKKINELIVAGETFNYANFANKSRDGYPTDYRPAWVTWRTRVEGAITSLFAATSAPVELVRTANRLLLIGNGPEKFELAKAHLLGALQTAREVLQDDTFGEIAGSSAVGPLTSSNRVFVVHGHDDVSKGELEIILAEMGLEPVVLHRQPDGGRTVIEKFEAYSDVGYAFVLLTPDELSYVVSEDAKADKDRNKEYRARPNVIFEFGYFVGKLGRHRTCCLYKSPVTLPSDVSGVIYKKFERSIEEVAYSMRKELMSAGYSLK